MKKRFLFILPMLLALTLYSCQMGEKVQQGNDKYAVKVNETPSVEGTQNDEKKKVGEANVSSTSTKVDKNVVKIGDKFLSLTVSSLDIRDGMLKDVTFSGTLEILGAYKWNPSDAGDDEVMVFMVDDIDSIPTIKDVNNMRNIVIRNVEAAKKLLPEVGGRARITITNYSIGERQIMASANIVSVIR